MRSEPAGPQGASACDPRQHLTEGAHPAGRRRASKTRGRDCAQGSTPSPSSTGADGRGGPGAGLECRSSRMRCEFDSRLLRHFLGCTLGMVPRLAC